MKKGLTQHRKAAKKSKGGRTEAAKTGDVGILNYDTTDEQLSTKSMKTGGLN